jgi:hypothetical protein
MMPLLDLHLGEQDTLMGPVKGMNDKGFFERLQVVQQNDILMNKQNITWDSDVAKFDHLVALVR